MDQAVIKTELIVDSILSKRISSEGHVAIYLIYNERQKMCGLVLQVEYYVRWSGYSNENNSWQTADDLNCSNLLETFNAEWEDLTDDETDYVIPVCITTVCIWCWSEYEIIIHVGHWLQNWTRITNRMGRNYVSK